MLNRKLILIIELNILISVLLIGCAGSSKILSVIPFGAKSHYYMVETLLIELSKRGHEITVISPFPQEVSIPNFHDIDGSQYIDKMVNFVDVTQLPYLPVNMFLNTVMLSHFENVTKIFDIPGVKKMLDSKNISYDLIITELFNNDITLGFVDKFKAPTIAFSSCYLMPWASPRFGNPDNPSYIPVVYSHLGGKMNFFQRTMNTLLLVTSNFAYGTYFNYKSEYYARKHFGDGIQPLFEIGKNTSLLLVNTHHSLHGVRPQVPGIIEVGGIHITTPKKLPKDLEKFINESEHGVIYFCMGSMLKASTLPEEKRRDIIEVFSKLPQRVLWKWETENMPDKPDNVKLAKWMPQRDILAHPNIKLFISHGGLLGVTEAVYSGVPIIGMPFYGDQGVNIEAVKAAGAGLRLDFNDLNKNSLYEAIKEILDNPKFKENAHQLSIRFKDRPQTPLETAVYWTEYVIRHKGAPHLRSAAVDLAWYQYLLLDVIAFLLVSFIVTLLIIFYTFRFLFRFIRKIIFNSHKTKVNTVRKNQ